MSGKSITIHGRDFPIVFDSAGVEHITLKALCEPFGLNVQGQARRLAETGWARVEKISTRRSDGKLTKFQALPLKQMPMYFATLSPGHVDEDFRESLVAMQVESADAVGDYFIHGGAIRATALPTQLERLRDQIEEILRPVPLDEPMWPARFVKRYEAWQGRAWRAGDRQPFSMKSANGFFWEMIFPPEVLAVIKARGFAEGVRFHQVLADVPRDYAARQLDIAAALADDCGSESEWRKRMRRVYGKTKAALRGQGSLDL